jgi:hypothetical protein
MNMADVEPVEQSTAYEALSFAELKRESENFAMQITAAKLEVSAIADELARRLAPSASKMLIESGKTHGTVNLSLQDGLVAKCVVDKKVEWDSEKLLGIAQSMPWDRVRAIFKIVFAVSETTYKGIAAADPALQARIDEARTTKYGAPKITIEEAK